jgi:hypothetical protein
MRKAQKRAWTKKNTNHYVEAHHVFPVSIYGKNSKTVCLTAREHYIAHMFLWLGLKRRYGGQHFKTKKMTSAAWFMSFHRRKEHTYKINSRVYEGLRKEFSLRVSESNIEKMKNKEYKTRATRGMIASARYNHPQLGKPRSLEIKLKIKKSTSGEKHHMWGKIGHRKGMKNKQSHRDQISETRCKKFGNIWEVTDPNGNVYVCKSLKKFAKQHQLNSGHMYSLSNGKLGYYKGWSVKNLKSTVV